MHTETKLSVYQKELKDASAPRRFSAYAFVFNSFYFLAKGMYAWFAGWFALGTALAATALIAFGGWTAAAAVLLVMRTVCAFIADRLRLQHIKNFIARNQNVNYSRPVIFYQLPTRQLAAAAFLSGGLFEFYWLYKNWQAVRKDARDEEIRPFWQGIVFGIFFVWPLMKIIRLNLNRSKTEGKHFTAFAGGYAVLLPLQAAFGVVPLLWTGAQNFLPFLWAGYLAAWIVGVFLLAAVQKRINFHDRKSNRKLEMPAFIGKWEIAVVLLGLALNLGLLLLRMPAEQNDENLGLALGSTYRMMEGYPDFCRKQGYEMTNFPKVYAKYFAPEIKIINERLQPYGLTMEQAWTFFRIKLEKVMDESIMSEFMALKPAIIELIVRQYKQEKVENFDEAVARKFLNDEITLPVLCSETDRHAQEIIDSNKTYQNFIRQTVNAIRPQQP